MTVPPPAGLRRIGFCDDADCTFNFFGQNSAAIAVAEAQYVVGARRRCYVRLCGCVGERVACG